MPGSLLQQRSRPLGRGEDDRPVLHAAVPDLHGEDLPVAPDPRNDLDRVPADRPLEAGERFQERWQTRTGEVLLDWLVTRRDHPGLWEAETHTDFIGTIIVRYEVEPAAAGCLYRRTLINPARPRAPTPDMIRRIDEEAALSLHNIRTAVENLKGRPWRAHST